MSARSDLAATALGGTAAVLLVSSLVPGWLASGPGSSYRGYGLASALRNGSVRPDGADLVFWALVSVGLSAAAVAATAPFHHIASRIARALIGGLVVGLLVLAATLGGFSIDMWGLGPWIATTGGALAVASSLINTRTDTGSVL